MFLGEDVDELVNAWNRGEAHGRDSVKEAIVEAQSNLVERSGGVPLLARQPPSRTTVERVTARIANHCGVALVDAATFKTKHRATSEQSHRRVACLVGMMESTHILSVPEEDLDIREELKLLPEDTRFMYDIVSEVRGTAVFPVKPHNIWTIDDTTIWKFIGKAAARDSAKLVTKESVACRANDSVWMLDESNSFKGISVSLTFAFSGAGTALPIVVCVSGLTESELPDTDFLHLVVPGLCVGAGANIQIKSDGHVLFMRSTERARQKKFRWHQKKIFIPGVKANRAAFDEDRMGP